ncbi:MAG TPA: N-acetyltransferase [Deltaproteobacteria bacterium]|mgnify:CR=1 FL=1|nr:N-acetyltransferase [Deltaproteobacteria bacterium]
MIRQCTQKDFEEILAIINDAAQAYKGVIPDDCWHEPYMPGDYLRHEMDDGVHFWGWEESGQLTGIMGIQDKVDFTLIRHAYVHTAWRNKGIGSQLLKNLQTMTDKTILIGTWAAATWAISFYEKNGYRLVSTEEKNFLLKKYWKIPARQTETSVVLVAGKWP